jgi:hypothetical protein
VIMLKKNTATAISDATIPEHADGVTSRCQRNGESALFSDNVITSLSRSLPEPICERRRELLPQILHEWNRTDLARWLSLDTRAAAKARIKRVELVRDRARMLLQALDDADEERALIWHEMATRTVSRSERKNLKERLCYFKCLFATLPGFVPLPRGFQCAQLHQSFAGPSGPKRNRFRGTHRRCRPPEKLRCDTQADWTV